jgi:hypothetical protein
VKVDGEVVEEKVDGGEKKERRKKERRKEEGNRKMERGKKLKESRKSQKVEALSVAFFCVFLPFSQPLLITLIFVLYFV